MKRKRISYYLSLFTFVMVTFFSFNLFVNQNAKCAEYPSKPFDFINPWSPGGTSDLQTRALEKFWKEVFGVQMKVEYMTGANGQIGWDALVNRDPDGYTLCVNNLPHFISVSIFQETEYTIQDHIDGAIARLVSDPSIIIVLQESKYDSIHELIEEAKKKPNTITVGICGKFTGDWIALKKFEKVTGVNFAEVYFPGSRPAISAVLGGHIDVMLGNSGDIKTLGAENVRVLAVGSETIPDILNSVKDEIGAPPAHTKGIEWYAGIDRGFFTHPDTPSNRLKILRENTKQIVNKEDFAKELKKYGLPMDILIGEEYEAFIKKQKKEIFNILEKLGYIKIEDGRITVLKR